MIKEFPYQIAVSCGAPNPLEGVELFGLVIHDGVEVRSPWNPLFDDGDVLRLAVALKADVVWYPNDVWVSCAVNRGYGEDSEPYANHDGNRAKALCMALLRAAAEIGRNVTT